MKITVVCGNGLGISLVTETNIESILEGLSISADIDHINLGSAEGTPNDIYIGTKDIAEQLVAQSAADEIVVLRNMIDKRVMREHLSVALTELGAL